MIIPVTSMFEAYENTIVTVSVPPDVAQIA